jgi:hypothetical protein
MTSANRKIPVHVDLDRFVAEVQRASMNGGNCETVAETLNMNPDSVYQRIQKLRKYTAYAALVPPLPQKAVSRVDLDDEETVLKLLEKAMAQTNFKPLPITDKSDEPKRGRPPKATTKK